MALRDFEASCESIESLVRCADVFGLHALAAIKGEPPDVGLIGKLITGRGVSTLAQSWRFFMTEQQREEFSQQGHLRKVGEHIVFASYVAAESYLIKKFGEYFRHMYAAPDLARQDVLLDTFRFRNLADISSQYKKILGLKISTFDHPQVTVYEEAPWFHPSTCWAGLQRLEQCRNQLAHEGSMRNAEIVLLIDAWSVFQFCRTYVALFDCNYDSYVYEERKIRYESK